MRVVMGAPADGATLKEQIKAFLEKDERVTDVVDSPPPTSSEIDESESQWLT